ncbi:MAG: hypothetical protein ACLTSG_13295 [Lachnospiraceae bacterium]
MKRFISFASAVRASAPAYSPGREMVQMFASGSAFLAAARLRYSSSAAALCADALPEASSRTLSSAALMTPSSSQSSEMMRSLAPAAATAGVVPPNSSTTVLFISVAMTATALRTPGSFISSLETESIRMESM